MSNSIAPTEPISPAEEETENSAAVVAAKIVETIDHSQVQFFRDGYSRIFNAFAPEVPKTPLRTLDNLFTTIIENPNDIAQGGNIDKRLEQIRQSQSEVMLTPEAKVLVEATLKAFDQFRVVTDKFRGGGFDSILHEGEEKEPETIELDGQTYNKYQRYWDYAPRRYGEKAYDAENGKSRDTEINNKFRIALEKKEAELKAKLATPGVTQTDLTNYISTLFLHRFASRARWTERGKPVNRFDF